MPKSAKFSPDLRLLLVLIGYLALSPASNAGQTFQIDLAQVSMSAGYGLADVSSWAEYKRIRQGDAAAPEASPAGTEEDIATPKQVAPASTAPPVQPNLPAAPARPTPQATPVAQVNSGTQNAAPVGPATTPSVGIAPTAPPVTIVETTSPPTVAGGPRLVYTRQPINRTPIPGNTADSEVSNFQFATDVARINTGLTETDIVVDALDGSAPMELFNCTHNADYNCAAQEGRVSPDGKKIVYSVSFSLPGPAGIQEQFDGQIHVLPEIVCAQLYIYDIASAVSTPIGNHPGGECTQNDGQTRGIDRQPAWLSDTELVFVSNRGNRWPNRDGGIQHLQYCFNYPYCVSQGYPYGSAGKAMQLWKMNSDGSGAVNWNPEGLNSLAPEVLANGDVLFSCYNAHADKGFAPGQNAQVALANLYWLCRVDGNGADMTVKLHGHKQNIIKAGAWMPRQPIVGGMGTTKGGVLYFEEIRGVRSVAEIFKGRIAVTTYYRANHNGSLGAIYGFDYGDAHVEGCSLESCLKYPYLEPASSVPGSGTFLPSSFVSLTPWGQSGDSNPAFEYRGTDASGAPIPDRSFGKAGYPAAYDKNHYLITHARGQCYAAATGQEVTRSWLGDTEVCRRTIMRVNAPNGVAGPTTSPFSTAQMTPLVDNPDFNVWDAKPIKTYQQIHGQVAPLRPPPLTPGKCFLQVVDARKSELYARSNEHPQGWSTQRCGWQGCAVQPLTENPNYFAKNMQYLSVNLPKLFDFSYEGNSEKYKMTMNTVGFMDIEGYQKAPLQADGSVKMEVPCDTPLLMSGLNANGEVIAHDDMMHSLRPGETRTCHGCHDAHSEERFAQIGSIPAVTRFATTLAANTSPAAGAVQALPKFAQIQPVLTRSCGGCHTGFENDPMLYSRVVWDTAQVEFKPWLGVNPVMPGVGHNLLWRPLTSRFVSKFALESPLYWYANTARMDGRTNATYNWDIDYKTGHPNTGISAQERVLLKDWLDNGAPFQ